MLIDVHYLLLIFLKILKFSSFFIFIYDFIRNQN